MHANEWMRVFPCVQSVIDRHQLCKSISIDGSGTGAQEAHMRSIIDEVDLSCVARVDMSVVCLSTISLFFYFVPQIITNLLSNDELASFFMFITGVPGIPLTSDFSITINLDASSPDMLPRAHTCFSTLDVSCRCPNACHLINQLRLCFKNATGFGFE